MSDEAATLAYFEYFLDRSRPSLTEAWETKIAEGDLVADSIEITSSV